jgi:arginine exporter protein ArgO
MRQIPTLAYIVIVPAVTCAASFLAVHDLEVARLWAIWIGIAFSIWIAMMLWATTWRNRQRRGIAKTALARTSRNLFRPQRCP